MAELLVVLLKHVSYQAVKLPNSRNLGLARASWTKDADGQNIPELRLNILLLGEAFVQVLATGLGTLALLWATVVLLGGFSTMLVRTDFWFTTAIIFIETAGVVGRNTQPVAKFFVDVPAAFSELGNLGAQSVTDFVDLLTMGPVLITATPIFAASGCITLSIMRLVAITRHGYGGSDADSSKGNLKPALILFYALVLTQGTLFLVWLGLLSDRQKLVNQVRGQLKLKYAESELIDRYTMNILDTCIDKGVSNTVTRNLVSFAADLLQSEHSADHVSAVTLLRSLILQEKRAAGTLKQIHSSQQFVKRLVQMLRSDSSINGKAKEYTAEIVAKLASDLYLADIPGSTRSISSLLDASLVNVEPQTDSFYPYRIKYKRCKKPLMVHGLLILAELAGDPDNCTEMSNTLGLVPKIIAPLSHGLHTATGNDGTSIEIVKASLGVVAKLVSGRGEISRVVLQELLSDARTANNINWILENSSDIEMKFLAVQILSKLTLNETIIISLQSLFIDPPESSLRVEAGRALTALAKDHGNFEMIIGEQVGTEYAVIQQLVTIMGRNENSEEYRAAAAELLAQICATSTTEDRNRLAPIASALSSVLKAIVDMENTMQLTAPQNPRDHEHYKACSPVIVLVQRLLNKCTIRSTDVQNQSSSLHDDAKLRTRKFLASFLGLAMQICDKLMITADAFTTVLAGIPMQIYDFVKTLKKIVENSTKRPEEVDCLLIIKNSCELAIWMMQLNPSYIQYFKQEDILRNLHKAAKTMLALERYMILSGRADEAGNYVNLSVLVEKAEALIPPQQP